MRKNLVSFCALVLVVGSDDLFLVSLVLALCAGFVAKHRNIKKKQASGLHNSGLGANKGGRTEPSSSQRSEDKGKAPRGIAN